MTAGDACSLLEYSADWRETDGGRSGAANKPDFAELDGVFCRSGGSGVSAEFNLILSRFCSSSSSAPP